MTKKIEIDAQLLADIIYAVLTTYKNENGLYPKHRTMADVEKDFADVSGIMKKFGEGFEGRGTLAKGVIVKGAEDTYTTHCSDRAAGRETEFDRTVKAWKGAFKGVRTTLKACAEGREPDFSEFAKTPGLKMVVSKEGR